MASTILYANGYDFDTDLGLIPVSIGGMMGAPAQALQLLDLPQAPGAINPGIPRSEAVRTLKINCLVQASSETTLFTTLDVAKEKLGTGLVQIQGPYSSTRCYYGVLQPFDAEQFAASVLNGWASVTLEFVCPMPYAVATTADTLAFGSTAVRVPLGTAPSIGRDDWSATIEIIGAATTPTLTYKNASGDTVGSMVFTYSPAAGDHIRIDLGRKLVQRRVSGTWSNAFTYLTAGYAFPALDPTDGNVSGALWPSLTVSSGTGILTYWKMYR